MEVKNTRIAYFSAEIGISASLPTYSGGLGVLSGDHIKAADTGVPMIWRYNNKFYQNHHLRVLSSNR